MSDKSFENSMAAAALHHIRKNLTFKKEIQKEIADGQDRFKRFIKKTSILTPKEARVLFHRFGNFKTLEQVGEMMGMTRDRVRQIEVVGLSKLECWDDQGGDSS